MLRREVLQCRTGPDGSVVALGNRGESWSPRPVEMVIADIQGGAASYVVPAWDGDLLVSVEDLDDGVRLVCHGLHLPNLPGC